MDITCRWCGRLLDIDKGCGCRDATNEQSSKAVGISEQAVVPSEACAAASEYEALLAIVAAAEDVLTWMRTPIADDNPTDNEILLETLYQAVTTWKERDFTTETEESQLPNTAASKKEPQEGQS